jgi:hypothetical protein
VRRLIGSVAVIAVGVTGVYWLMVWDAPLPLLAAFGAGCGAVAGRIAWDRRGVLPAAAVGFVLPLAYFPLWLALDLQPYVGIDL